MRNYSREWHAGGIFGSYELQEQREILGPRSGFISWVDEENHTYEVESQNLELEIHNEELQIQNRDLEIQNEELEIQNRNLKMLLIVSWILFFGIIVYKL
ncbi:unnamed protein product [Lactuca saligna]|uniref:Uncharacterized protein n=1 Tax=Lactuca saligna TaxID=75948 RepID=A0AA35ZU41_LACSI|nr:unnamed protein product [Lactuca saligna]